MKPLIILIGLLGCAAAQDKFSEAGPAFHLSGGRTTLYPDGTIGFKVGERTTIYSDGTSSYQAGRTTFFSDGSSSYQTSTSTTTHSSGATEFKSSSGSFSIIIP
jgi:hypothetical protein